MSDPQIINEFREFGEKIQIIAILSILSLIPYIGGFLGIINLVLILLALKNIKNVNEKLKNSDLEEFRNKIIKSYIVAFVGTLIAVAILAVVMVLLFSMSTFSYSSMGVMNILGIIFLVLILFGIVLFIAGYLEMKAWETLNIFFIENRKLFPDYIAEEAIDGTDNLRTGALMFLLFFLIITIFIGLIYRIIGYFKLAKLKELGTQTYEPQEPISYEQYQSTPDISPPRSRGANFCPLCGTKLEQGAKFCSNCGSQLE